MAIFQQQSKPSPDFSLAAWHGCVLGLVKMTKLQVRRGDFENHVLVALDQRHPTVHISVGATDGLEFHIDLEERTVSANECTP